MSATNGTHYGRADEGGATPRLRVISVGDGAAARELGRDARLEVVRARDGFEAIGESGLAPVCDVACPTLVLLSAGVIDADEMDQFVQAVHLVDPAIRVVVSGDEGSAWTRIEGLERIGGEPTVESLLDLACGAEASGVTTVEESGAPRAPAQKASHEMESSRDGEVRDSGRASRIGGDDSAMLRGLLSGRSLGEVCLEMIRRGVDASVRFAARESDAQTGTGGAGECMVAVSHGGTVLGWLIGGEEHRELLAREAERMALALVVDRQQQQLRDSAFVDHLTGAWNRRYFEKTMETLLKEARAKRLELTLLLFDIDDFKMYNDRYGHAAGDEILVETVRLLRSTVRPGDRVCRIGGDEFAVIFYEPSGPRAPGSHPPRSIFEIATRFQRAICEHRFPKLGEDAHATLSVSGGLATFPWDGHDGVSLLDHADRLLLQSKREGKNAICLGPGAMRACGG